MTPGEIVLELDELSSDGRFSNVSLTVRAGEIVGLYGLVGSGAGDIAGAVYGMEKPSSGRMLVSGKRVAVKKPAQAKKLGIHMLPANRSAQGSFSFQSIAFNITVGELSLLSRIPGWVVKRREREIAHDFIQRLAVKTPSEQQPISAMSGGNAQKVVLARQLVKRPVLLVLAEPTQGVDVGAKEEIHRIISDLANEGMAALIVTSDLGEVLRIADRILVVRAGEIAAEFGPDATQVEILAAAAGAESEVTAEPSSRATETPANPISEELE